MTEKYDILANLRFSAAEDGGRKTPISATTFGRRFGCPFVHKNELYDSFVLLEKGDVIAPGDEFLARIRFLSPEIVLHRLSVGDYFELRELNTIAHGTILQINVAAK